MTNRVQRRLSRIENFFSMLLTKKGLSANIIVGELPPTTSKDWDDFVNVDVGQQKDYNAYSTGYANIYLYARPVGSPPKKNIKALDKMEAVLDAIVDEANNKDYIIEELYRDSGYDTNRQFHFDMICVSVTVK